MKNGVIGVGIFLVVVIFFLTIGTLLGWIAVPFKIFSAENTEKQFNFAYQYEESLKASAIQYCSVKNAPTSSSEEKTQRTSQYIAIEQNYARIQAEYDARLRNAFEAKYVKPSDVPTRAPSIQENVARNCK